MGKKKSIKNRKNPEEIKRILEDKDKRRKEWKNWW